MFLIKRLRVNRTSLVHLGNEVYDVQDHSRQGELFNISESVAVHQAESGWDKVQTLESSAFCLQTTSKQLLVVHSCSQACAHRLGYWNK
jgi:hypothetical protein